MKKPLAMYPSKRAYSSDNTLLSNSSVMQASVVGFHKLVRDWLSIKGPGASPVIFITTSNRSDPQYCIKSRGKTESKHNMRNIEVVMDLLLRNQAGNTTNPQDIKVITQYA